jgi:hypothetical protein
MGTGGSVGGKTLGFDIRIIRHNTDQEVQKYAELLKAMQGHNRAYEDPFVPEEKM